MTKKQKKMLVRIVITAVMLIALQVHPHHRHPAADRLSGCLCS